MLAEITLISVAVFLADGAKILCVFPFPALSHQIVFQPIWRELSLRKHEVTVITTHPLNDASLENLEEIDVGFLDELVMKTHDLSRTLSTERGIKSMDIFLKVANNASEEFFRNERVQALIRSRGRFDVILGEMVFPAWFALSEVFESPLILMNSMPISLVGHDSVGNPTDPLLLADFNLPFGPNLGFWERLASVAYSVYFRHAMLFRHYPEQSDIARRYLGKNVSDVIDIQNHVDLVFAQVIPGFHPARPVVPAYVELNGLHHENSKPLPEDLKKYLDDATEGVVYVSFGSIVRGEFLTQNIVDVFRKTFSRIPFKVLWRYETDLLEKSPNVKIEPWFPQQDLLRHPNVKLFITHGGLQSISEAISSQVPMIGIPFFGDQFHNALRFGPLGMGLSLDRGNLCEETFRAAILEVIGNPKYRLKMKALADLAIDQPIKSLHKAVWWIEYVIRHKGAKHLRNPAVDAPFYRHFFLDVSAFLALILCVLFFLFKRPASLFVSLIKRNGDAVHGTNKVKLS